MGEHTWEAGTQMLRFYVLDGGIFGNRFVELRVSDPSVSATLIVGGQRLTETGSRPIHIRDRCVKCGVSKNAAERFGWTTCEAQTAVSTEQRPSAPTSETTGEPNA